MNEPKSKLYIDLDTVFDTRIATLAAIYPQVATELLTQDSYWHRESDDWTKLTGGKVKTETVVARYAARDDAILQASVMTNIFAVLFKMIAENEIAINDGRPNNDISIVVNIWPYSMDDIEMEMFRTFFSHRLRFEPEITFIKRKPESVTPAWLTQSFAVACMYDFNGWIKMHLKNLVVNRTQGFNLIVPRLFEKDVSGLSIEDKKDEVAALKLYLLEYMLIHWIDPSSFSVFRPG